jgi:hypothetical protein
LLPFYFYLNYLLSSDYQPLGLADYQQAVLLLVQVLPLVVVREQVVVVVVVVAAVVELVLWVEN